MHRLIYMAGVNAPNRYLLADRCSCWLLSVALVREGTSGLPLWLRYAMAGRYVLWDCGAFSTSREPVRYHEYLTFLARHVTRLPSHEYLQFDVMGDPEATDWYYRDMLRRRYRPWKVIQPGGDTTCLYTESYAALGGLVGMKPTERRRHLDGVFYPEDGRRPTARIHLLGVSGTQWLERYPARSADSTNWLPYGPWNRRLTPEQWATQHYGWQDVPYQPPAIQCRLAFAT